MKQAKSYVNAEKSHCCKWSAGAGEAFCTVAPLLTAHHCLFCSSPACSEGMEVLAGLPEDLCLCQLFTTALQ